MAWERRNGTGHWLYGCLILGFKIIGYYTIKKEEKEINQLDFKSEIVNVYLREYQTMPKATEWSLTT